LPLYHFPFRDGRLQIGDEVLFINGQSLLSMRHKEAVQHLQAASNPVQLVISRMVGVGFHYYPFQYDLNILW